MFYYVNKGYQSIARQSIVHSHYNRLKHKDFATN